MFVVASFTFHQVTETVIVLLDGASDAAVGRNREVDVVDNSQRNATAPTGILTLHSTQQPVFILHVGPPKTGSTTLQCTLESLRQELDKDSIAYIGRPECPGQYIDRKHKREFEVFASSLVVGYDCQKQMNVFEEQHDDAERTRGILHEHDVTWPTCWNDFLQHLDTYRQAGKNIVFSDEAMSNRLVRAKKYRPDLPYPWKALKSSLERMGWDVRILLVHRPLYDFLPSVYVEQYKDGPNKVRLRRWFRGDGRSSTCPQDGGREVPQPFATQTSEITIARLLVKGQTLYPTPAQVYELSRERNFTTILVDITKHFSRPNGQVLSSIQHIICDKIPGTLHTCKAMLEEKNSTDEENQKERAQKPKQLNPSLSLHYDFIAVEACQRGLLNGTTVRRDVARRAIQRRQEQDAGLSPNDFPLICPDDKTLGDILQQSLEHERRLHTAAWDQEEEADHVDKFWKTVRGTKKFCTVDSKKVVEDKMWIDFFSAIHPE